MSPTVDFYSSGGDGCRPQWTSDMVVAHSGLRKALGEMVVAHSGLRKAQGEMVVAHSGLL